MQKLNPLYYYESCNVISFLSFNLEIDQYLSLATINDGFNWLLVRHFLFALKCMRQDKEDDFSSYYFGSHFFIRARYISLKLSLVGNPFYFSSKSHLQHYFDYHVCLSILHPSVRHKNFFSLKSPWNHPLTPGADPRG